MAKQVISDKEMAELEAKQPKQVISDKEMEALESSSGSDEGPFLTAIDRGMDVVSGGYLPQIEAGLEQLIPGSKPYVQRRDELINTLKKSQEANPISSAVGTGLGIAGSMYAMPGLGAAKAASSFPQLAGQVLKNVGIGAGMIAAQNPGDIEGEVSPLQLEERAINLADTARTPMGKAMLALPALAPALGYGAQKLSGKIPVAQKMAYMATGPTSGQVKGDLSTSKEAAQKITELGQYVLDKGYVPGGVDDIYFRSKDKLKQLGSQIGEIYSSTKPKVEHYLSSNIGKAGDYFENTFDLNKSNEMLHDISQGLSGSPNRPQVLNKIENYFSDISNDFGDQFGSFSSPDLEQLHKLKTRLGQSISWSKTNDEIPEIQEAYKYVLQKVNSAIDNELNLYDKVVGGQASVKMRQLNRDYHLTDKINSNSLGKASSEMSGRASIGNQVSNVVSDVFHGRSAQALNNMKTINAKTYSPMGLIGAQHEVEFSGYPATMTMQVTRDDYDLAKSSLEQNPELNIIERAKRLNLLNKYGRVYLGQ